MNTLTLSKYKKPDKPLVVKLKGSKSFTNRALILASIANGKSRLLNASHSDDTALLVSALRELGFNITKEEDTLVVDGGIENINLKSYKINIGPAGTVVRFLTAFCSAVPGLQVELFGTERMHKRPIGDLVEALKSIGADIDYLGDEGSPPLLIRGKKLKGGKVKLSGSISSQYFTALMQISSLCEESLDIEVIGKQTSSSYIDMTASTLKSFGVELLNSNYERYTFKEHVVPKALDYHVEGDGSGASYFFGLAALIEDSIKVYNVSYDSVQGDIKFVDILKNMGCKVAYGKDDAPWVKVTGTSKLDGVETNMDLLPDCAQTLAVVAAFASGTTKITGLHTLRHKETDRIKAVQTELKKSEIETESTEDSLSIFGGNPKSATFDTYEDHRMAMSFALMASKVDEIKINEPEVVGKSFPDFFDELLALGINYK